MSGMNEAIAAGREASCRDCAYKTSCDTCAWQEAVAIAQRVDTVEELLHEIDAQCGWCRTCRLVGCDWFVIYSLVKEVEANA